MELTANRHERSLMNRMLTAGLFALTAAALIALTPACDKKDDSAAPSASSSAQAAPSGSADDHGRFHEHDHDWDGGHGDHGDRPH
jgi:hypothetical protein